MVAGGASTGTLGALGPTSGPTSNPLAALRVVFVDDETANCKMLMRMLTRMGVLAANVTQLHDGKGSPPPLWKQAGQYCPCYAELLVVPTRLMAQSTVTCLN